MASKFDRPLGFGNTEAMRSLEKVGDWEKLGVWMVVVWSFLPGSTMPGSESVESIEEVTLKLLLRRPSALQGFEDLYKAGRFKWYPEHKNKPTAIRSGAGETIVFGLPAIVRFCLP